MIAYSVLKHWIREQETLNLCNSFNQDCADSIKEIIKYGGKIKFNTLLELFRIPQRAEKECECCITDIKEVCDTYMVENYITVYFKIINIYRKELEIE